MKRKTKFNFIILYSVSYTILNIYILPSGLLGPKVGIWRNGRRSGLNQIEPGYGDVSSGNSQIQGNLGLFSRQS